MSEELKQSIDGVSPARETAGNQLFDLVVKCYRDVYRRAGIPFTRGENRVVGVTEAQVRILEGDSVLKIVSGAPAQEPEESGTLGNLGVDSQLNTDALNAQQITWRILAAVAGLDKNNPNNFTSAGSPKVAVVSAALGESITGEQLKVALASQVGDA
ncbi:HI1506-related protein [Citrobacter portucalensis]|uniref:HI1506-related protein n=1 Tax=Citrobacter portucalensis TaxID=1639133 RepID=UPI00226BBACA|nr:HI1506-related protein [Citrobacter portucalensis]MCX9038877.1 HI1506-related protein [Citrobacter portucalensis]